MTRWWHRSCKLAKITKTLLGMHATGDTSLDRRMSIIDDVKNREEVHPLTSARVPCLTVATEMVSNLFKRIDERGLGHLTITDPFLHYVTYKDLCDGFLQ